MIFASDSPKVHIHMPRFYNDKPIAGLFLFLFRDKIKLCDIDICEYLLTPSPNSVITFSKRQDIKKMWIEDFFLKVTPKKSVTKQERQEIINMINCADEESKNLGVDLAFNSDLHDMGFYEAVGKSFMGTWKNDKIRFMWKIRDYLFLKESASYE